MQERVFKTEKGSIHYYISILNTSSPTLVLLPGLTADHRLFERQISFFEGKMNLLTWDAPGHFVSAPFDLNFSLEDKVRWLDGILTAESIDRPVIVGQSMGGYVGQAYSRLFPEKLSGFISIDSAPLQKSFMTNAEIWMLKHTEGMYRAYPWRALVRDGAAGCAESEYGRELMKTMMLSCDGGKEGYVKLVSQGYRMLAEAVEKDLPYALSCPVLLICGEKDRAGSCKAYNRKWAKATGYTLRMIAEAGHNSNTDRPDEINALIEEFLHRYGLDD